jgi:hypothetical protein
MKIFVLSLLCMCALTLAGCSLLDSLLIEKQPILDETGAPLYLAEDGELTPVKVDPKTGKERQQAFRVQSGTSTRALSDLASGFGPWGALAGGIIGLAGTIYARIRGKQLGAANAKLNVTATALRGTVLTIEKIKELADANKDGRITAGELRELVRARGKEILKDPATYAALVEIAEKSLSADQFTEAASRAV